jgi:hypothetical protein
MKKKKERKEKRKKKEILIHMAINKFESIEDISWYLKGIPIPFSQQRVQVHQKFNMGYGGIL